MKKKILVIGLGWQGEKLLKYFKYNKNYLVYGCCKTQNTKKNIEEKYNIKVSLDYKKILEDNNYDLVISTVFPTHIQYDIVKYILENTINKVLIDLPITFNLSELEYILSFNKLYIFNIEHYTKIFKYIENNKLNIKKVEATLLINKKNLSEQSDMRKALIVDKFYMLNNLLSIDFNKINLYYKEKKEKIKDIEFFLKIYLNSGKYITYKYEDSKGIIINNGKVIIDDIKYTNILGNLLNYIFGLDSINNTFYKNQHINYWSNFIN